MSLLPESITNYILLFNSHKTADIIRQMNRQSSSSMGDLIISRLNLPKYILHYNKASFERFVNVKSLAILNNSLELGIDESSDQLRLMQCLSILFYQEHYSRTRRIRNLNA
jgi:hypothetical protein